MRERRNFRKQSEEFEVLSNTDKSSLRITSEIPKRVSKCGNSEVKTLPKRKTVEREPVEKFWTGTEFREPLDGNKLIEFFNCEGHVISLEENPKEFQLVVHNATVLKEERKKIEKALFKRYGDRKIIGKKACPILWLVNLNAIFETMNRRIKE